MMTSRYAVIKVALLAIFIDVGLARMVSEAERREMDEDAEMKKKFKDMCTAFRGGGRQHAMLWVGKGDYTSEVSAAQKGFARLNGPHFSFALFPTPKEKKDNKIDNRKRLADSGLVPIDYDKHTEMVVLQRAEKILASPEYKGKQPNLYLYTRNSPCCTTYIKDENKKVTQQFKECRSGCSKEISDWVVKHKKEGKDKLNFNTLYIAWEFPYDPQSHDRPVDQQFLYGLEKMFNTPGLTVYFTETDHKNLRFCATVQFKWLQQRMYACLKGKVDTTTDDNKKCNDDDLARLVNRITWICGIRRLEVEGKDGKHEYLLNGAREPQCWYDEIGKAEMIIGSGEEAKINAEKRGFFQTAAKSCMESFEKEVKVGLPLSPSDPEKYSTKASDLKDLNGQLCSK
eukprot:Seg1531.6 transcript_id=Seg1531.6/GoldUCD/mRNA.D3Y31 product="hypothetical protein" protein_id=Seg1531.6/GoldUCD/D3Y31